VERPLNGIEQQLAVDGFLQIGDRMYGKRLNLRLCRVTSNDDDHRQVRESDVFDEHGLNRDCCSAASVNADGDHCRLTTPADGVSG